MMSEEDVQMAEGAIGIKRALVSVSDKTGVVEFCQWLQQTFKTEIISTGGTAKLLAQSGLKIVEISDYTGFPEMMSGRLKTLHPKVHGGILARRGIDNEALAAQGINEIDLVCVNLYPFEATVAKPDCDLPTAIENIDIGGPTMLRAAAKNWNDVAVVCDPKFYSKIIEEGAKGGISKNTRFELARSTFEHTARYDSAIATWLGCESHWPSTEKKAEDGKTEFGEFFAAPVSKIQPLRYGENPHQSAAVYMEKNVNFPTVVGAKILQGKELSYNNIADADAALDCALAPFTAAVDEASGSALDKVCVIVKHANPCGVARSADLTEAYEKAFQCDPTSAFGGIIAFNCPLTEACAAKIIEKQFVEVILAPTVEPGAVEVLKAKKNVRVMEYGDYVGQAAGKPTLEYKKIMGGLLVQDRDEEPEVQITVKTKRQPTEKEMKDLLFAWRVCQYVKSNAIVYAKDQMTYGIGAGQMSRVFSSKIAVDKAAEAKLELNGAAMASDAFFPFKDGVEMATQYGVSCIIQPGGSIRDQEVIDAADEAGIAMVFTGVRHFKH